MFVFRSLFRHGLLVAAQRRTSVWVAHGCFVVSRGLDFFVVNFLLFHAIRGILDWTRSSDVCFQRVMAAGHGVGGVGGSEYRVETVALIVGHDLSSSVPSMFSVWFWFLVRKGPGYG